VCDLLFDLVEAGEELLAALGRGLVRKRRAFGEVISHEGGGSNTSQS
jgi:hypothetical protein